MSGTRFIKLFLLIGSVTFFASCEKDCDASKATVCEERVPANETCKTKFKRWFYDEGSNTCQIVEYTGCSQRGYATEGECQICVCD